MSVSSKSKAPHVRPVGEDFSAPVDGTIVHEARSDDQPTAEVKPVASAENGEAQKQEPKRRRMILPVMVLAVLVAGGWYGYDWWTTGRFMVSTDDAYIEGDIASISPKVSGYVEKVNIVANQHVKAGDPLITLENGDYRIAAEQAQAQIDTENLSLQRFDAQIAGAKASLQQAQAQKTALEAAVRGAETTQKRASDLQSKAVGTVASLDSARWRSIRRRQI